MTIPANSRKRDRSSPTGMFGGVEALLKEGQDWWVEDQAQVASGFNNWNLLDSRRGSSVAGPIASLPTAKSTTSASASATAPTGQDAHHLNGGGSGLDLSSLGMGAGGYDDADWFN